MDKALGAFGCFPLGFKPSFPSEWKSPRWGEAELTQPTSQIRALIPARVWLQFWRFAQGFWSGFCFSCFPRLGRISILLTSIKAARQAPGFLLE